MKIRRSLAAAMIVLLVAGLLAGCGAAASDGAVLENGYVSESVADSSLAGATGSSQTVTPENQKLIRTINLDAETEDMDALLAQIDQRIAELEGYVEEREVYNGSSYSSTRYRYANLTIRIPANNLDLFVGQVSEVSNITSNRETTEDVTLSYVATQSRIAALETEQTRLLELLEQAETMEDLLLLESKLTDVRTELEEVTSQLRLYDNLVDYGTIHLALSEVREYTVVEEPQSVWERMGSGFMESLKNLGTGLTEFFIFAVTCLPYLIPVAVIAVAVLLIVKLTGKKTKKNDPPKDTQ